MATEVEHDMTDGTGGNDTPRRRGPGKPKRVRRSFQAELQSLESRVGLALLILNRVLEHEGETRTADLCTVARDVLQGK
jgi:hypothetical protein